MRIVARKRRSGLIEPLAVGVACCVVGVSLFWLLTPFGWYNIALGLWCCAGGGIFILAAVKGWSPSGIALVFTDDGIWCNMGSPRGTSGMFSSWGVAWRWDELAHAHFAKWEEFDGTVTIGVILELKPDARPWPSIGCSRSLSKRLQDRVAEPLCESVVQLTDSKWDWRPEEAATWINESVSDPASRERWGGPESLR